MPCFVINYFVENKKDKHMSDTVILHTDETRGFLFTIIHEIQRAGFASHVKPAPPKNGPSQPINTTAIESPQR
jgi:hypothetical protein